MGFTWDKFIVSEIEHKHAVACDVQAGQPERFRNRTRLKNAAKNGAEQLIHVRRWRALLFVAERKRRRPLPPVR